MAEKVSESHRTKLVASGIPLKLIEKTGIYSATADDIFKLTGVRVESTGIVFPYPGETDGYARVRLDQPAGDMKYVAPRGGGCRLYVPPGAELGAPVVVITEGEKKALVAVSRGINCVAVAGIDAWRERGPFGEKKPPDLALIGRLKRDWEKQTIILVYDSDINQEHPRWDAFPMLAEILYSLGAACVKVLTLPALDIGGKVGLDDYILVYEKAGENPVEKFWELVDRTPEWVPLFYAPGAEKYAQARLKPDAPADQQVLGAVAILATQGETGLQSGMKAAGIRGETAKFLRKDAVRKLPEVRAKQSCKYIPQKEKESPEVKLKTFAEVFPPARKAPFADYPIPLNYDIKSDGRVVKIDYDSNPMGVPVPVEHDVIRAPVALAVHLVPADGMEDDVLYELWWWHYDAAWRRAQFPAGIIFNAAKFDILANKDLPVDSNSKNRFVAWMAALRDLRYDFPDKAKIPCRIVVSRSGWHTLPSGREVFAVGRDIFTASGVVKGETGSVEDDVDLEDPLTEWRDVSINEKQLLDPIRAKGTLEAQLETYLRWIRKYPLIGFFVGAAAAGPLMRVLVKQGLSEIAGFVVESTDPEAGHGKTLANRFAAGVWGVPETGEKGMIRTAHRTTVHTEILFGVHCDISCHVDETQLVRFSDMVAEMVYSLGIGSGKERGAKHGGGRKTRYFYTVLVLSAEQSVLDVVNREGVHHRVLSLPPVFPEKNEFYRQEAETAEKELLLNYGNLGRVYVQFLLNLTPEGRESLIVNTFQSWRNLLAEAADVEVPVTKTDGSAEKNQTLKRIAKRAAACAAGLELLLRASAVSETEAKEVTARSLDAAWEYITGNVQGRPLLEKILSALRSYVWENQEAIQGLRKDTKPPVKWLGKILAVGGKKYIALARNPLVKLFKDQLGVEYDTAAKALAKAGFLATAGDRESRTEKLVRFGGTREWMLVIDTEVVFDAGDLTIERSDKGDGIEF